MVDLLTKLCIISTIIGISMLIIISDKIDIGETPIQEITKEDIDKPIKLKGTVSRVIKKGDRLTTLELTNKENIIEVIIFNPNDININTGSFIEVSGKVSIYQDRLQIIADTVKI